MTSDAEPVVPDWVLQPFRMFGERIAELKKLTDLSVNGISALRAVPELDALLAEMLGKDNLSDLTHVKSLAEFAQHEFERGFPLLYAQATVSLWSYLEFLVKDFLLNWLLNEPTAIQIEAVTRIKVPISQYDAMTPEERRYYILDSLEKDIHAPLKQGVSRFESLLELFGLSGPVDPRIPKSLFELSNIRNVLVHRGGKADKKLVEACPWLGLSDGDSVTVTASAFKAYSDCVEEYFTVILQRVLAYF